jgi:excinuclease ABC subunit C
MQFYQNHSVPKEIITSKITDPELLEDVLNTKIVVPTRGIKQDLVKMSAENAIKAMQDKFLASKNDDILEVLDELAKRAKITSTNHIEMIDNSHLQGDEAVGAVVVFTNGIPNKKMYRKYAIKHAEKRDDTASMYEVIYRRFYRKLVEQTPIGDLLIVDGGITQLNAARKALNELNIDLSLVGLAKDNKHTTRALVLESGEEVDIKDYPPLFFLLTKMQDEVHRFVISYHRNLRSKSLTSSLLDEIEGIGDKRKEHLLKTFGSIQQIIKAPLSELEQYVPKNIALKIKEININE